MLTGREAFAIELAAYAVVAVLMIWKHRQLVRDVEQTAAREQAESDTQASEPRGGS